MLPNDGADAVDREALLKILSAYLSTNKIEADWQGIRQSPTDEALRPGFATKFDNLWLAGDWTRTGLPATIEGSLQSGFRAAKAALENYSMPSNKAVLR